MEILDITIREMVAMAKYIELKKKNPKKSIEDLIQLMLKELGYK